MSRLYLWDVMVQPNEQKLVIAASTIESAIALATQGRPQAKVIRAVRGGSVDLIEQLEQKGHPFR